MLKKKGLEKINTKKRQREEEGEKMRKNKN